jgi:hypothetical protein
MTRFSTRTAALAVPLLLAASATVAGLAIPASAGGGVVRYASPDGGSTGSCAKSAPCDLVRAINSAPGEATVIIETGTYDKTNPLVQSLLDVHGDLTIRGEGKALPTIYSKANPAVQLQSSSLSHVRIMASQSGVFDRAGAVNHVIVEASGASGYACGGYVSLTDSVCVDSGADGSAISLSSSTTSSSVQHLQPTVTGVTAEATAASGTGLLDQAGTQTNLKVRVTNSILHGGKIDAEAQTTAVTGTSTIVLRHTDLRTSKSAGSTGFPVIDADGTDIHKAPKFVKPGADNFAERPTSPTVNAGASESGTDILGRPRWIGRAPDMGAYELRQPPLVAGLISTTSASHTAGLVVRVNPEGLATKVTVKAVLAGHPTVTATKKAGAGRATVVVHLKLSGLRAGSTYQMTATATSAGGSAHTQKKSLRTRA